MKSKILQQLTDSQNQFNESILNKLENNIDLTDEEILGYKLNKEDQELAQIFSNVLDGQVVPGFDLKNFLASPQAKVLIPKVIIGAARKSAEPVYLASKFFKKVRLKSGSAIQFPSFGVMRAYDVAEGAEIPAENIDWNLYTSSLIKVGKCGIRIQYTDEIIQDTEFDIVGQLTSEAGRAMGRHKEQKAFTEFRKHGWTVFDNFAYNADPVRYANAHTNGVDYENKLNGTLSLEDYLDIVIAVHNNEYTPTDTIMHPLAFPAFIKNGLTGALTAVNEKNAKYESPNHSFAMGPEAMAGKLPFGLNLHLSTQAPINRRAKTFDIIVLDRNNVGTMIVRDDLKTEGFRDASRDLNNLKLVERYGFSTKDQGRAVCMAKNIAMAKSYPEPLRVKTI